MIGSAPTTTVITMPDEPPILNRPPAPPLAPTLHAPVEVLPPLDPAAPKPKLPLGLTRQRLILAFAIAGVSDLISAFAAFVPPVEWAVDFVTALLLFMVLGWHWLLLPGLIMEAIPGVAVVPFWVLVVGAIAAWGTVKPKVN